MVRTMWMALALAGAMGLASPSPGAAESLDVVVTIKPIHSLAAAVMEGAGEPKLLIKGAGSPHSYAMKPSDARMLASAGIIIRVSEYLETFLEKPLAALSKDSRIVSLDKLLGVTLLPVRESGAFEAHDPAEHASPGAWHATAPREEHGPHDAHIWLSPANAAVIADQLGEIFAQADPPHKDLFRANAARVKTRLAELTATLRTRLEPLRGRPFIVFHDAYHYFEAAFGIEASGSITLSPERQVGAARIKAIRAKIAQNAATCVFSEPQFEPKLVATVIEGTPARKGVLDPLGASLPEGKDQYFNLLTDLAGGLEACLGKSP